MKKLFYLLLVTVFFTIAFTSCRTTSRPCAAYGEEKYYQIEKPF